MTRSASSASGPEAAINKSSVLTPAFLSWQSQGRLFPGTLPRFPTRILSSGHRAGCRHRREFVWAFLVPNFVTWRETHRARPNLSRGASAEAAPDQLHRVLAHGSPPSGVPRDCLQNSQKRSSGKHGGHPVRPRFQVSKVSNSLPPACLFRSVCFDRVSRASAPAWWRRRVVERRSRCLERRATVHPAASASRPPRTFSCARPPCAGPSPRATP